MATCKTLFDAVEAELCNARTAVVNAGAYMDLIKDAVTKIENSTGMEAPLSLSCGNTVTDLLVKTENGEYGIPIAVDSEDKSLLKLRDVSKKLKEHMKLL